jgi:cell division initiation protein
VKVTPLDIRRKEFKRGLRGYSDEEVDVFLDDVADEFERLFQENMELQDRMARMEEQIAGHTQLKEALEKTLVSAQLQADQVTANARKEAELILRDAELKARHIVNDSYGETQKVQQSLVQLKHLEEDFRFKFRSLLEGHLNLLTDVPITPAPAASPLGVTAGTGPTVTFEPNAEATPVEVVVPATEPIAIMAAAPVEFESISVEPTTEPDLEQATGLVPEATPAEVAPEAIAAAVVAPPVSAPEPVSDEDVPTAETEFEQTFLAGAPAAPAEAAGGAVVADEPTADSALQNVEDATEEEQVIPTQGYFFGKRTELDDEPFFASQPPAKDKSRDFEW